ncbi:MAG: hypothetical protein FD167_321 [bacterium]|nr:MAG: hypothetical protein FD167_321 [bacterium]
MFINWPALEELAKAVVANYCVKAKERIQILSMELVVKKDLEILKVSVLFDGKPDIIPIYYPSSSI